MPIRYLVVAVALLAVQSAQAADLNGSWDDPVRLGITTVWKSAAAEPPSTRLLVGDDAPSFSYLGADGQWHRSLDLAADRPLLLVFGATDQNLVELENKRALFEDLGVTPVVVTDRRTGSARAMATRLGFTSPVVADPKCAIADLFNTLDPLNHRHAPSFFVIDEKQTIRALQHGPLPDPIQLLLVSARGLGRPLPESVWTWVTG